MRSFLRSGYTWTVFYVASRLGMLAIFLTYTDYLAADVNYYAAYLNMATPGLENILIEYPVPAAWILQLIYFVGGPQNFFVSFAFVMAALDAALTWFLWRKAPAAGAFWIVFTLANGAIMWFRFDLIPTALVTLACMVVITRPRISGALIGIGAAIKLWPALLIVPMVAPDMLGKRSPGRARLIGFAITGFGLALASLAFTGWTRTASPLAWQSDRGLQVESILATPFLFWHAFGTSSPWKYELSEYNAYEVFGPGVDSMLSFATFLTVGAVFVTIWAAWRLWLVRDAWTPGREQEAIALAALIVSLAMLVSNKTFSTQYLLWIGGPIAVLLINQATSAIRRELWVVAFSSVAIGLATQFIYPWAYGLILAQPNGDPYATSIIVMRNIGVVALLVYSCVLLNRVTRNSSSSIASSRQPSLVAQ